MQRILSILLAGLISVPAFALNHKEEILRIADSLSTVGSYSDSCSYEILMPSMEDPVNYAISIETSPSLPADTLAPCHYIISWTLPSPKGTSEGFSAYFNGDHYRYRDHRLQEYHAKWDPAPFSPGGLTARGVQNQVQFSEIIPQFIANKFREIADDPAQFYTVSVDTMIAGRKSTVIKGSATYSGYNAVEYEYVLDSKTLMPVRIRIENNPEQLTEQSISVKYSGADLSTERDICFETLDENKSDIIKNYSMNSMSLDKLPGRPFPRFTLPTTTGERYLHENGEAFAHPTIFVFVDATDTRTSEIIDNVRCAVDNSQRQTDIIWAFLNHRLEEIDEVIVRPRPGEHLLMNAGAAAQDLGINNNIPVFVFAGTDGKIIDFIKGYNKDLASLVIEITSTCK